MRRELEIPLQLARVDIKREQAIRVEVVAGSHIPIPVLAWIACTPVDEVQLGVVSAGNPGWWRNPISNCRPSKFRDPSRPDLGWSRSATRVYRT